MSYFSFSIEKITWPSLTLLSDITICIIQNQTLSSKICFSLEKHVEMKKKYFEVCKTCVCGEIQPEYFRREKLWTQPVKQM